MDGEAKKAQEILRTQRNRESSHLASKEKRLSYAKNNPTTDTQDLKYPKFDEMSSSTPK